MDKLNLRNVLQKIWPRLFRAPWLLKGRDAWETVADRVAEGDVRAGCGVVPGGDPGAGRGPQRKARRINVWMLRGNSLQ